MLKSSPQQPLGTYRDFIQGDSSFTARTINPIKKLVKITKL
jgi:hypothetical protein